MAHKRIYLCSDCGYQTTDPDEIQEGNCPECDGDLIPRLND